MERFDLVLRSRQVVTPRGVESAAVLVKDGVIASILPFDTRCEAAADVALGEQVLFPGIVDTHAHINEPGRTEWEGFRTATRAAAAGGVTTVVDMPLNSIPPTVDPAGLSAKRAASAGKLFVDVGLWGGVVPGNARHLRELSAAGLPGFKCFLVPSGVDEFAHVGEADLREALPILRELGSVLLVHAEAPGAIAAAEARMRAQNPDPRRYATYLATRPPEAELEALELLVRLARDTGARIHVVHFACADAIETLRSARAEGLSITAETCPHYLYFDAETIEDGATAFKCAPPIREKRHALALAGALKDGVLDYLVSDHSPCVPELKRLESGDFLEAWGGIASLQLGLGIAWTLAEDAGLDLSALARLMCRRPAEVARLSDRKGAIEVGKDADFAILDPNVTWTVRGAELAQRHPITPYEGRTLRGKVTRTYLRGDVVFDDGRIFDEPRGRLLQAKTA